MKKNLKRNLLALAALSFAFIGSTAAKADSLTVTPTSSILTGAAGTTVTFDAVVANPGADPIYINGDGWALSSPSFSIDDTPLFSLPYPIDAGSNTGTDPVAVFNLMIAPGTAPGIYTGQLFTIYGGADGGAGTAFNDLVDIAFTVEVTGGPMNSPEPGTWLLLASGFASLALLRRRANAI